MQGNRARLGLDEKPRPCLRKGGDLCDQRHFGSRVELSMMQIAARVTPLGAMDSGEGQAERKQHAVQLLDASARDHCDGAARTRA
jgi:hypothetical protein